MSDVIPYEERIGALSIPDLKAQVALVHKVLKEVMVEGEDYGKIPGVDKPTIFKAGAEKLCLLFRLDPQYEIEQKQEGQHLTITSKCTLYHIPTGKRFGSGMGSCSTKESRYAYRHASRKCPECGVEAIIKGKDFKGDGKPTGWLCYRKKNGCGAKFLDGDTQIEAQTIGRIPNEDVADQYNTVLKMANKRSQNAAVLTTTGASALLTQDVEDMVPVDAAAPTPPAPPAEHDASERVSEVQLAELIEAFRPWPGKQSKLLKRLAKDYGTEVSGLQDLRAADFADAIAYAKGA